MSGVYYPASLCLPPWLMTCVLLSFCDTNAVREISHTLVPPRATHKSKDVEATKVSSGGQTDKMCSLQRLTPCPLQQHGRQEDIMLDEIRRVQKDRYYVISLRPRSHPSKLVTVILLSITLFPSCTRVSLDSAIWVETG